MLIRTWRSLRRGAGDFEFLNRRIEALDEMVVQGTLTAGSVVPTIGRAAMAFALGDFAKSAHLLEEVIAETARIGGSGAQREVIEDTLIVALMRCGETDKARALLDLRLQRRPSRRDVLWRTGLGSVNSKPSSSIERSRR